MTGGRGEQGNHVRAGSVRPWAESQKHLQSHSDVRDITCVRGRKMSCARPGASRECSVPSPRSSPQSKGRLAWVEGIALACPLHSKWLRGKTAPKPRNYAATLPLRMSHCLCLHRGAEKTCLFQKDFLPGCGYPQLASCPCGDCKSLPHATPLAVALPFAKDLFSPERHRSSLQGP